MEFSRARVQNASPAPAHREARRRLPRPLALALLIGFLMTLSGHGLSGAKAEPPPAADIGTFTAVEGQVSVTRSGAGDALLAKLRDDVRFLDIIETERESRSKALLNDDSILTVGERSRLEITEHIYDPSRSMRSVVVNLVRGKVRALVGKVFTGTGSKFEIHTPTAVAAARGTYFVVWHADGGSGIANIGTHGTVDFQSGGSTVRVDPGNFSMAPAGGAPSLPAILSGSNVPAQVTAAVQGTTVQDNPDPESPRQAALSLSGQAAVPPAGSLLPGGSANGEEATSANTVPAVTSGALGVPITAVIVPAVISGAAPSGSSGSSTSSLSSPSLPPVISPPPTPPPVNHSDNGLHLGQHGLQPGHGGPIPGQDGGYHGNGQGR